MVATISTSQARLAAPGQLASSTVIAVGAMVCSPETPVTRMPSLRSRPRASPRASNVTEWPACEKAAATARPTEPVPRTVKR